MQKVYEGNVEEYWNDIFDALDSGYADFLVFEKSQGGSFKGTPKRLLKSLVENFAPDGYAVVWRAHLGSLFVAIVEDEREGRKQDRAFLGNKGSYEMPSKYRSFDFFGVLNNEVVAEGRPLRYRLSLDSVVKKVAEMTRLKSDYANQLREQILALGLLMEDPDLAEVIDMLWDFLVDEMEDDERDNWVDLPLAREKSVSNWLSQVEKKAETTRRLSIERVASALDKMRFEDSSYDEWLRRCIVKLHNQTVANRPVMDKLAFDLLDQLEESREVNRCPCLWCGAVETQIEHYVDCPKRKELYKV